VCWYNVVERDMGGWRCAVAHMSCPPSDCYARVRSMVVDYHGILVDHLIGASAI